MDAKPEALHFLHTFVSEFETEGHACKGLRYNIMHNITRTLSIAKFTHKFLYNIIIVTRDYFLHESVEI